MFFLRTDPCLLLKNDLCPLVNGYRKRLGKNKRKKSDANTIHVFLVFLRASFKTI